MIWQYSGLFVHFHGWWVDPANVHVVMEYLGWGDLSLYVDNGLEDAEAKEITENILTGLDVMHREGFAHRDIKPQVCS